MLIDLSEVMATVGRTKDTQVEIGMEKFSFCQGQYAFVKKEPVAVTLVCTGERKISISCKTQVSLSVPCSRCLEEVEVPFVIDYEREFDFSDTDQEAKELLEEAEYIQEHQLDVEALIAEELALQFPMQTLCREDCKGICSVCGTNLNTGTCECDQQGKDPRMLAIQDIFKNFGQTE